MRMPWNARVVARDVPHVGPTRSIGDPALVEYLNVGHWNESGESVSERSALSFTAFWRGVQIIAGTIAGLPLKTYRDDADAGRVQVGSVFDEPCPTYFTRFEWVQLVMVHLCVHGNAYLLHRYNDAGALAELFPLHPSMVSVEHDTERGRIYKVKIDGEQEELTDADLTHVMGMTLDGLKGLSPIEICRNSLGSGLAADRAAARMFGSGLMIGGLVTSDESLEEEDAKTVIAGLKSKMGGARNAGDLAFVNASLKISPWSMTSEDAQFLESRVHQVEEVARILGIPPHLLGQTEKQTSWGTGVAEQNRGLARYTLRNYTTPFEQRCSRLLANPRFVEFEYKGLLQAAPEQEIPLLIAQKDAGILTADEVREILNLPPLPAGAEEPSSEEGSENAGTL